jgi:hypothetical protein
LSRASPVVQAGLVSRLGGMAQNWVMDDVVGCGFIMPSGLLNASAEAGCLAYHSVCYD